MERNKVRVIVWDPEADDNPDRIVDSAIPVLRDIGYKMSQLEEERLRQENPPEAWRRIDMLHDPPCVVCGAWSDDWLCPRCRERFPWMHPLRR